MRPEDPERAFRWLARARVALAAGPLTPRAAVAAWSAVGRAEAVAGRLGYADAGARQLLDEARSLRDALRSSDDALLRGLVAGAAGEDIRYGPAPRGGPYPRFIWERAVLDDHPDPFGAARLAAAEQSDVLRAWDRYQEPRLREILGSSGIWIVALFVSTYLGEPDPRPYYAAAAARFGQAGRHHHLGHLVYVVCPAALGRGLRHFDPNGDCGPPLPGDGPGTYEIAVALWKPEDVSDELCLGWAAMAAARVIEGRPEGARQIGHLLNRESAEDYRAAMAVTAMGQ